jgi:HPt (histidine-containing phosphotransfer) domain-containing protein
MKSVSHLEEFVDLKELLDRVENDQELLAELFALFQEELPANRTALQKAINEGDLGEIERAAHKLNGMLANLSAQRTAALAAEVESSARVGNTPRIGELMLMLEPQITAFSVALGSFMAGA